MEFAAMLPSLGTGKNSNIVKRLQVAWFSCNTNCFGAAKLKQREIEKPSVFFFKLVGWGEMS